MSLTGLCVVAALLHLLLLHPTARAWRKRPQVRHPTAWPPLTVVTAARNEVHNLPAWWAALQTQSLAPAAIVVADDRSTDGTSDLLRRFQATDRRLRIVSIAQDATSDFVPPAKTKVGRTQVLLSPKKRALTHAIAAAPTDYLAFTDADCRPRAGWLAAVAAGFAEGADLVLGYSPYRPTGRRGLDRLIAYETFHTAFLYLGDALRGRPWMGVGRNLAYRRSWFEAQGGFGRHADRLSGDDDLLVAWAAPTTRVAVVVDPSSWVESEPPPGWRAWWRQKRRHVSASKAYPRRLQLRLGVLGLSQVLFWTGGLATWGLAVDEPAWLVRSLLIFVCYLTAKRLLLAPASRQLGHCFTLVELLQAELLFAGYQGLVVPSGWLRLAHWK